MLGGGRGGGVFTGTELPGNGEVGTGMGRSSATGNCVTLLLGDGGPELVDAWGGMCARVRRVTLLLGLGGLEEVDDDVDKSAGDCGRCDDRGTCSG